ncbi:MAG: hypothetical protein KIS85_06830 [Anaerolineales bacterium]|nr:hypothetical protein [Anaerolineales bacterium]
MNPVTEGLLRKLNDPQLDEFARCWGELEALVIEIYRQKAVSFEQQESFFLLREELLQRYPPLAEELGGYWPLARVKGEAVTVNPFEALIGKESAKQFVENWEAMRYLPAAREAINQLLMGRIERAG